MQVQRVYPAFWQGAGLVVLYIALQLVFGFIFSSGILEMSAGMDISMLGMTLVSAGAATIVTAIGACNVRARKLMPFVGRWMSFLPGAAILSLGISMVCLVPLDLVTELSPFLRELAEELGAIQADGATLIVVICLIGPLIEECLFRGILWWGFEANYGPRKALILTTVLFALCHLNPIQFIPGIFVGLLLAWLRWHTGSLYPCVVVHVIYNSIVVSMSMYIPEGISLFTGRTILGVPGWAVAVMVVLGGGLLLDLGLRVIRRLPAPCLTADEGPKAAGGHNRRRPAAGESAR